MKQYDTRNNSTPELVTFEPEFNPVRTRNDRGKNGICGECPKLEECRERVANDWPAFCELWDEEDVFIAGAVHRKELIMPWNESLKEKRIREYKYQYLSLRCADCGRAMEKPGLCRPCLSIRKFREETV